MKKLILFLLASAGIALVLSCGGSTSDDGDAAGSPAHSRQLVIIAVDGLRADALGAYGAPVATPAIDGLAAESVRFEWAFAQAPEMMPSLAAMLSGLYPTSNGMRSPGDRLHQDAVTLAEVCAGAGLRTAAFVEGAPGGADFGLAQGFESYQVVGTPGVAGIDWMTGHAQEDFLLLIAGWGSRALDEVATVLGEDGAIDPQRVAEVLASRGSEAVVAFNDEEMARVRAWYAARVQAIDAFVGEFMAAFRSAGLDRTATLVVLGTNGIALQEHGDLFGETVYAPVTRVPMMIRFPDAQRAGVNSKVVEVLDLMPTLAEIVGAELPAGIQGSSLLPVIEGASNPPYIAFGESRTAGGQRFAALAGYRAVVAGADRATELYHTAADPLELDDIAASEPDKVAKLEGDLEAWSKMVAAASLDPELRSDATLDEETLKQLESLGYVQ